MFFKRMRTLRLLTLPLLLVALGAGCGDDDNGNGNDGGQPGNHRLVILTPPGVAIGLAPNAQVTLRVRYLDANDAPVPDASVSFSIVGNGGGTTLGSFEAYTDSTGTAEMLLLAGGEDAYFTVEVTAQDALPVTFEVAVSEAGFTTLEVLPAYDGAHAADAFTTVRAQVYFDDACEDHPPTDTTLPDRQRYDSAFGILLVFENLPADRDYAVVLRGLDAGGALLAWGCAEVSHSQLIPGLTVRLNATAQDVRIQAQGSYTVTSDIALPPSAAPAASAAVAPAQDLGTCDLGVEQRLLDCLVDSAFPDGDVDCDPQTTDPTALAIADLRGTVGGNGCRSDRTSLGDPSLEVQLRQTLDATGLARRDALHALAAVSPEAFTHLQVRGRLTFVRSDPVSQIYGWHQLQEVSFPDLAPDVWVSLAQQGNHPLLASSLNTGYQTGTPPHLVLPPHDLALHPDWSAWSVAHAWLLAPLALATAPAALLAALIDDYEGTLGGDPVQGCPAVDALICQALGRPDTCLTGACDAAVEVIEQGWDDAWSVLAAPDGADARFTGNVPLEDPDGDLVANGLGTGDEPGTWLLTLELGGQSVSPTAATFSATRISN